MEVLIVVDLQNDFCRGGCLEVRDTSKIISIINDILPLFHIVIFTQDWHPPKHKSFEIWPIHCIADTEGAKLHPDINLSQIKGKYFFIQKGIEKDVESYSGFFDEKGGSTGLFELLSRLQKERGSEIEEIYICGVAGEFCVRETTLDCVRLGFYTNYISDCVGWITDKEETIKEEMNFLRSKNVWIMDSDSVKTFLE